jgi:DNA-binding CsgD family transcriptional regulator/PAS domain-containing protein
VISDLSVLTVGWLPSLYRLPGCRYGVYEGRRSFAVDDAHERDAETMNGMRYDAMSLLDVTQQARDALADGTDAALVMQVPSGRIIAARPSAAMMLDPQGGEVEGHQLEEFTSDEPSGALALFADGRINGYEASRTLARQGETDLRVNLWHKRFDHQSTSRYALVLITESGPDVAAADDVSGMASLPVVGAVSKAGLIEQISSGTEALFGEPPDHLLGSPVSALVVSADTEKWDLATSGASRDEHAVTVVVRARGAADPSPGNPAAVVCDVLLLPLQPGFTFVFLPVTDRAPNPLDTGGVRSMLVDLSRVAGIAQSERQKISGLREQDLPGLGNLTTREREMFTRLISGYRVSSIAEDLVLSPSTVRTHLASIFTKLGVSNQSELLNAVRASRPTLGWSELYPSWHADS